MPTSATAGNNPAEPFTNSRTAITATLTPTNPNCISKLPATTGAGTARLDSRVRNTYSLSIAYPFKLIRAFPH